MTKPLIIIIVFAGVGKFNVADIDTSLCTHVIYAFTVLNPITYTMEPRDAWLDVSTNNYGSVVALKEANPNLKVLVALGGWADSQQKKNAYNSLFSNSEQTETFIK